jgi:hypothetical protein
MYLEALSCKGLQKKEVFLGEAFDAICINTEQHVSY